MTPEMRRTLTHFQEYFAEHGIAPSFRELAAMDGARSTNSIHRRVHALLDRGHLVRVMGRNRAFALAEANLASVPTDQLLGELERRGVDHG